MHEVPGPEKHGREEQARADLSGAGGPDDPVEPAEPAREDEADGQGGHERVRDEAHPRIVPEISLRLGISGRVVDVLELVGQLGPEAAHVEPVGQGADGVIRQQDGEDRDEIGVHARARPLYQVPPGRIREPAAADLLK